MRAGRAAIELLAPVVLVVAAGTLGAFVSQTNEIYFITALIQVSTVVAIYVFVGNSGVLSFGHISFFAVGVWAAGVLSSRSRKSRRRRPTSPLPRSRRRSGTSPPGRHRRAGGRRCSHWSWAFPWTEALGSPPALRRSRCSESLNNLLRYYEKIGPGLNTFSSVPETTDVMQATVGAVLVVVAAFDEWSPGSADSCAPHARTPRPPAPSASPSTASGSRHSRSRASLPGSRVSSTSTSSRSTSTRCTSTSRSSRGDARHRRTDEPWGAVVGALFVSALDLVLAENLQHGCDSVDGIDLPSGSRIVVVSAVMALVVILRPSGLTGGREFSLPRLRAVPAK